MASLSLAEYFSSRLHYHFQNIGLLEQALTHRSFGQKNNERLEFLGDSVLNFTIAQSLFNRFPSASEGDLSRLRASLVQGETLAVLAHQLGIGSHLRLGEGELKSGGRERPSILADALEALFGAVLIEAGFDQVKSCILRLFKESLDQISLEEPVSKDPKSALQEWLQARKKPLPQYDIVEISGEAHCQRFTVSCKVSLFNEPTVATATSRRNAEKEAAENMLVRLGALE